MKYNFLAIPKNGSISMIEFCKDNNIPIINHQRNQNIYTRNRSKIDNAFCIIRNPIDRVISAYAFLRQGGVNDNDKYDFEKYIAKYSDINHFIKHNLKFCEKNLLHFKSQHTWVKNGKGFINFENVRFLRFDHLEDDLAKFSIENDLDFFKISHKNSSNRSDIQLNDDSVEIIKNIYREDFELVEKINRLHTKKTIIILTHIDPESGKPKLPHIENIYKHNPQSDVRIIVDRDSSKGKEYYWKNGDKSLRKWWKMNCNSVMSEEIIIVEWDTLIDDVLPNMPKEFDLVGYKKIEENLKTRGKCVRKWMKDPTWKNENWWWWPDISEMELDENTSAVGLISFGFYMTRKWVLDSVCNSKWDKIYKKSIQNELRFPTIAKLEGARIGEIDLPFVHHKEMKYQNISGIYHPIKEALLHDHVT
jgi:hypothetical protein